MDFYYGKKNERGISIIRNENLYIFIPNYILEIISEQKMQNWAHELKGKFIDTNTLEVNKNVKLSDIYKTYYHFIE